MAVLHKAHVTTRDTTVLHKGLVSARTRTRTRTRTRILPGPALPAASQRSCSSLHRASCYPCCRFKTSPTASPAGTVTTWATTSPLHRVPRAGAARDLGVQALRSWGDTRGLIPSLFSVQTSRCDSHAQPTHGHAGDHHHLPAHRSPSRLEPSPPFAATPGVANPHTCSRGTLKMGF